MRQWQTTPVLLDGSGRIIFRTPSPNVTLIVTWLRHRFVLLCYPVISPPSSSSSFPRIAKSRPRLKSWRHFGSPARKRCVIISVHSMHFTASIYNWICPLTLLVICLCVQKYPSDFIFRSVVTNRVKLVDAFTLFGFLEQGLAKAFYFLTICRNSQKIDGMRWVTFNIFFREWCQTRGLCINVSYYVINQQLIYTEAPGSFIDLQRITRESCTITSVLHNFRGLRTIRLYTL